ncbi:ArsR family transcriptional regulator [Desulfobacter hydrogenophilus]|uniref:ArsR family transcriptional regulator n=1 Tax=Desulfobacter hydrogenophilus TaxID=2291 RepID=A0A328F7G9_9BACT|nr:ArsR family transcriptional regulator [Desulfobacter hydrogenophilus]NDY73972.1 ArsR family transcriptional regulator [Desulfobacter hydrogenophilus]QBH14317.1 ArsR family transcriptional regulator [Desulfobacter hydrogenophilus]RAM00319.1 ArsR family transcriptional regulator [Desulfobacter hydrogenophilus]
MASLEQTIQRHLRITILRLLAEDPNYTLNDSILADLVGNYGFTPSRDRVRTELSWLREQGLVRFDDDDGIIIAVLTQRGNDVAHGRTRVPGVKRPGPGS